MVKHDVDHLTVSSKMERIKRGLNSASICAHTALFVLLVHIKIYCDISRVFKNKELQCQDRFYKTVVPCIKRPGFASTAYAMSAVLSNYKIIFLAERVLKVTSSTKTSI